MMTIHDWIEEQRRLLTRFEQWWEENHKVSSVQFPLSLNEADWAARFTSFASSKRRARDVCITYDFG
jgi:hypothetical protein